MTTDIAVRYDPITQDQSQDEYDGGNSSSRLFERARIKALAGKLLTFFTIFLSLKLSFEFSQRNVKQYKRKHFANGSIRIWHVPICESAISTST